MRKQNSTFKTAFISEIGSGLENNDYFAYVELEEYACYVIADGLNDMPKAESARLATQTIIMAFQEHPSMKKGAMLSYLKKANKILTETESREKLKASVTVIVTDYAKLRYGYAGNTRLRIYRDGAVKEQTQDMSLGYDSARRENLPDDALQRHEQRNNLHTYLGLSKGFRPFVSKKIKLVNGDILAFYTRGIWENLDNGELDDVFSEAKDDPQQSLDDIEDMLLSKQPEELENYTFAAVFVDKVYLDPNQKRRIKKIVTIAVTVFILAAVAGVVFYIFYRQRQGWIDEMSRRYSNTIEYIQDDNFLRAKEECAEALKMAEKLRMKDKIKEISDYQKLIEAVNLADEAYESENYEKAQTAYVTAKERSRYADRIADEYIDEQLARIIDYLSVFDYIQMGDTLTEKGDYDRAEEKYLEAKALATKVYFEAGRKEAMDALEALYALREKSEEADKQEAKDKALDESSAAGLASDGDKAFAEGDYEGAQVYYAMALEAYEKLGDTAHGELIKAKMDACSEKAEERKKKEKDAEAYVKAGKEQEKNGDKLEAKKQYLLAKKIYKELKMDDKVMEVDGLIEILENAIIQEQEERERLEKEEEEAEQERLEREQEEAQKEQEEKEQDGEENEKENGEERESNKGSGNVTESKAGGLYGEE